MTNVERLLYILSPSFSGSTLLTILLARHPEIATIGELKASAFGDIETYRCSCGISIHQCDFWQEVKRDIEQKGGRFDLRKWETHFVPEDALARRIVASTLRGPWLEALRAFAMRCHPGIRAYMRHTLQVNRAVIDAVCRQQGARTFLDGSKDPIRLLYFTRHLDVPIKVIALIRDGRGVVNSTMKHDRMSVAAAAEQWCETIREIDRVRAFVAPENYLQLHYEDLCRDTDKALFDIERFVNIAARPLLKENLDPGKNHILGNDMRLRAVESIQYDERWRETFSARDHEVFERIAGTTNRSLGYSA
jgi:hypothetical protein